MVRPPIVDMSLMTSFYFWFMAAHAHGAGHSLPELLAPAPKGWDAYIERASHLQGKVTETVVEVSRPERMAREGVEFKHTDTCALVAAWRTSLTDESYTVIAENNDYAFELTRRGPSRPWALASFATNVKARPPRSSEVWERVDAGLLYAPLTFINPREQLPNLIDNSDFRIVKAEEIVTDGERLVKIDFVSRAKDVGKTTYKGRLLRPGRITLEKGSVTLDPERYWLIRDYAVRSRLGPPLTAMVTGKYEYKDLNGLPVLSKVVRQFEQYDPNTYADNRHESIYEITDQTPPDGAFRLTAYGLPEPVGFPQPKQVPHYVWFLITAACCAILALGFRYLARRNRPLTVGR